MRGNTILSPDREFLRRFYDALQHEARCEATTVSEAIQRHQQFPRLKSLVPGSWIHANFNVWIGAPEDNRCLGLSLQRRATSMPRPLPRPGKRSGSSPLKKS